MQIKIYASNLELNAEDRLYLEEKLNHLADYGEKMQDESVRTDVNLALDKTKTSAGHVNLEVTMFVPGAIIRAEVYAPLVKEAADIAFEKLKRQIDKYKSKKHRRDQNGKWIATSTLEQIAEKGATEHIETSLILKRKSLPKLEDLHEEEALHQLELLDHDFFVYKNIDTGKFSILYRRHKEGYGALEWESGDC